MQRVSLVYKTPDGPVHSAGALPGVLSFDLSGSGAIKIQMTVKKPGAEFVPAEACQTLRLDQVSDGAMAPYTSLVHDVFAGDRSLFTSERACVRRSRRSHRSHRCRVTGVPRSSRTTTTAGDPRLPTHWLADAGGSSARVDRYPTEIIFVGFPQRHAADFVSPYAVIVTLDKTE